MRKPTPTEWARFAIAKGAACLRGDWKPEQTLPQAKRLHAKREQDRWVERRPDVFRPHSDELLNLLYPDKENG